MGREVEPKPSCVVVITRGLPSASFWIARCKTCGWRSQPSQEVSELRPDAYEHEHQNDSGGTRGSELLVALHKP